MRVNASITDIVKPAVEALGFELVGCEYMASSKPAVLRVYIDKEGGVNIDDCSKVSRQVSSVMDVENVLGRYNLEVSSPGINRPLFELADFVAHLHKKVKIRMQKAVAERKTFVGTLTAVDDQCVHVEVETEKFALPFDEIKKANLYIDVEM